MLPREVYECLGNLSMNSLQLRASNNERLSTCSSEDDPTGQRSVERYDAGERENKILPTVSSQADRKVILNSQTTVELWRLRPKPALVSWQD